MGVTGDVGLGGQTWRPGALVTASLIVVEASAVALAAFFIWFTLWSNAVQAAGWIVLALGLVAWGWLAARTVRVSATLTPDNLTIRNIFTTENLPLAEITALRFRKCQLRVTHTQPPGSGEECTVSAIQMSAPQYLSGQRTEADDAANAIAAAAHLPAPSVAARRRWIGPRLALLMIPVGLALGTASYFMTFHSPYVFHHRDLHAVASMLIAPAGWLLGTGISVTASRFKTT